MNQLVVFEQDGQLLVDSREVAEMTKVRHDNLLSKIDGYIKILSTDLKFKVSDFFIESAYQDSTKRLLPCFLLTRKGCDMVANKMTGEKGVIFTATYVTRFEEMQKKLNQPKSQLEILQQAVNQMVEHDQRISKLEDNVRIDAFQQTVIQKQINKRVYKVFETHNPQGLEIKKLFPCIHRNLRDAFGVPTYKDLRKLDFDEALSWVQSWRPLI